MLSISAPSCPLFLLPWGGSGLTFGRDWRAAATRSMSSAPGLDLASFFFSDRAGASDMIFGTSFSSCSRSKAQRASSAGGFGFSGLRGAAGEAACCNAAAEAEASA